MPLPLTADLIVFGVQSIVKLGTATEQAYEQWIRDADASLPLLPANWPDEGASAAQFFRLPEMQPHVAPGGDLAAHWDAQAGMPKVGIDHNDAVVARWRTLASSSPLSLPRDSVRAGAALVRQWDAKDPNKPPPPYLRVILALADVALDFAQASPTLLAQDGAPKSLLGAIAKVAVETRSLLPDLQDPNAWKGDKWIGANFAQSLLVTAFSAGLGALAEHPDLVVKQEHVQHLITATLLPLKQGFDAEANKPGATPADIFATLFKWEELRDDVLPGMVTGAIKAIAADRNSFLGSLVKPGDDGQFQELLAAISNSVLDQASKLSQDNLLLKQTWLDFFRSGVAVIASRPELAVTGANTDAKKNVLHNLVSGIAGKIVQDAQVGAVGQTVLLDVATAALDSVRTSLPLLLGPAGTWDGVAGNLAGAVIDAVRPALAGQDPALLKRLASRDQVAQFVGIVVQQVAATPKLVTAGGAGQEVQSVIAALAGGMAAPGADLLHPAGWLAVATAAAKAAAINPGRLFKLPTGADAGIGASLISIVLQQADAAFTAATHGKVPPVLAGPVLQDVITNLLTLASQRRLVPDQVTAIGGFLFVLAGEAMKPDGRIVPGELPERISAAAVSFLAGKLAADANIDSILKVVEQVV